MNLGADPKKVAWLAGLLVLSGVGVYFYDDFSSPIRQLPPQCPYGPSRCSDHCPLRFARQRNRPIGAA